MNNQYWQPELETMPREELEALQVKKLRKSIEISLKSPFYKKRLGDLGITPDSIQTIADIRKIPFTTKQDLRDNYPFGLVGGDMKDAIRIHSTSGTTGHPTVVTYSRHDIDSWANMIARDMYMVGCRDSSMVQRSWVPPPFPPPLVTPSVRLCLSRTSVRHACMPFHPMPSVWRRCSRRRG